MFLLLFYGWCMYTDNMAVIRRFHPHQAYNISRVIVRSSKPRYAEKPMTIAGQQSWSVPIQKLSRTGTPDTNT